MGVDNLRAKRICTYTLTMLPKSRMGANECAGQLALPYRYAGAMPGVNEWAMHRLDEMVRSGVRCRPGRHLIRAVLPGALRRAGEAAYFRGDLS